MALLLSESVSDRCVLWLSDDVVPKIERIVCTSIAPLVCLSPVLSPCGLSTKL